MTKQDFLTFINKQQTAGAVRFSLGYSGSGEVVLYWTNGNGQRVWRILTSNRGTRPSKANKDRMTCLRRWLCDARKGMKGDNTES